MPYKRSRSRRSRRRPREQGVTLSASARFPLPTSVHGLSGTGGIIPSNTASIPQDGTSNGLVNAGIIAETPESGIIGMYTFNFSRWLYSQFGQPSTTGGPGYSLGGIITGWFNYIRFGKARMTMTRVDAGVVMGVTQVNPPYPVFGNVQTVPSNKSLKVHYIRLQQNESTFGALATNIDAFMRDRRRKTRVLKVGRSLSWSFVPLCNKSPSTTLRQHTRDYATVTGPEDQQLKTTELLGRRSRLGRIPMALAGTTAYDQTLGGPPGTPTGLGYGVVQIMSSTLLFLFEEDIMGQSLLAPSIIYSPNFTSVLRRTEFCSCRVSGLKTTDNGNKGNLTAIVKTVPWSLATPIGSADEITGFYPPTIKHCDLVGVPPWRQGEPFSPPAYVHLQDIPIDFEKPVLHVLGTVPAYPVINTVP